MPQTKLGFVLIGTGAQLVACADRLLERGHRVIGVISDSEEAAAWALRVGVPRIGAGDDQIAFVSREPYDYLLSIVNHTITSDALLATPTRGAINYHDSALPAYAGFNATAWSIADGQKQHAVTWHEMLTDVDSGRIFVQRPIPIGADDTAFTLGVKCSEAGVEAFAELLTAIEGGSLAGAPQGAGRSFHYRSERPSVAVLDWAEPAAVSHRLVRALTHGPDDNWMCLAKVVTGAGVFAVGRSGLASDKDRGVAGTVLAVDGGSVSVRTADGVLTLHELAHLDGRPLAADALAAHGFSVGEVLPAAKERFDLDAIAAFDAQVTKSERFWVRRLRALHAPALSAFSPLDDPPSSADLGSTAIAALPAALIDASARATVAAAFGALVARLSDTASFDLGVHVPAVASDPGLATFYADAVPLRFDVDKTESFGALRARIDKQLARLDKRVTFARDVTARYGALRDKARAEHPFRLPIGLCFGGADERAVRDGQGLVLALGPGGCQLRYDRRAIDDTAATDLFDRFVTLLTAAVVAPGTRVRALPLLTEDERVKLLETWQDTACDYAADRCMHQLFEAQAERTPDAVAVVFCERQLTYRELNERANRVARALMARGVETETLVGVCIRRSLDMMVGLLGILKAGGAYVPMDPVYPKERLGIMLEDSGAKVLLTQRALAGGLPHHGAEVVCIDELDLSGGAAPPNPNVAVGPDNLAYVIFTSGSTGRPKGVMVQHGNVSNFFTGMDARIGAEPGVLLAVTSISFDISVLELFWTLSRGFEVVIQPEADIATLTRDAGQDTVQATAAPMDFGLFYFAADSAGAGSGINAYRLLIEGAKFADTHGFAAVWTPERHFHAFGGLYPNPAVTSAALAVLTENVQLRGGSVVLPLHNPLRVVEEWSVVDNLSEGRIELSFASGWHVNDFTFRPENYERRREVMVDYIGTVRKLWRGEAVTVKNGAGQDIDVITLPRPVQDLPPLWLASAGSKGTFETAGRLGADILTNMLGQDLATLETNFKAYRAARAEAGHEGPGRIAVMLHTYVCEDTEKARRLAKKPFCDYLMSSFDLVKVAPWMFPAFKQPSKEAAQDATLDTGAFSDEDMQALLDYAFDRYFDTAGLFGSPERALEMVENLKRIGATECACLIDFGVGTDDTLAGLEHLNRLRVLANPGRSAGAERALTSGSAAADGTTYTIAEQLRRRNVTHLQCTPSMARMLVNDPDSASALRGLKRMMVGGEAFPDDLRLELAPLVSGEIINMYGPTETTIWSTTSPVTADAPITIGRPIANTVIRVLDADDQLVPIGTPGELCIGGAGVVRGYFGREDLTEERFVDDPYAPGSRLYRTGDLARYRRDGVLEFLGRLDHQVKVNGYRIELGEIESVLSRHSSVHQSVVVARQDDGVSRLVAYVVAQGSGEGDDQARINIWRSLWDEAYKQAEGDTAAGPDPRFDYSGWASSYDGELIAREQMSEWLDGCAGRILELAPARVLEIGCGTGMILYRVLPEVEHYTAVDLSPHALSTIAQQLTPEEAAKTTLLEAAAHTLDGFDGGALDTVVINSVCQYFPSAGYLTKVLAHAASRVQDGGRIFIGDVRSAAHERLMMTALELHQAPGHLPAADVRARVERRLQQQSELLLSPGYFERLVRDVDRITAVEYQLKRGAADNEMTRFRYDVVLHVGTAPPMHTPSVQPVMGPDTLDGVRALLASEPAELWLTDVPNRRLTREADAMRRLASDAERSAQELRADLLGEPRGVSPEALFTLDPRYAAQVVWATGGDVERMDVVLRHRDKSGEGRWPFPESPSGTRLANEPAASSDREALIPDWQTFLRDYLPEYMMPAAFVVLDALPLTPNGKIDRKALPAPRAATHRAAEEYVAPASDLEQTIAQVWREMLNLEQVGIHSNIFDLGANSLLTVQANNRLNRALGKKVSLVAMFRFPTVHALAKHLGGAQQDKAKAAKRTETREERKRAAAERRRAARARRNE